MGFTYDRKKAIPGVWLIFAAMFAMMSGFHFYWSAQSSPEFVPPSRPLAGHVTIQFAGMDLDRPLQEFAKSYNSYVAGQNASSRWQNLLSGIGYVLASLTAIFSLLLETVFSPKQDADVGSHDANERGGCQKRVEIGNNPDSSAA